MRIRGPVVLGLALALAKPAFAQKAEADAAFQRGKALMAKGQTAEACSEFETSMRLEPLNGTLYNLALCHEAVGKIASAWSELKELAANDKNAARAKDAARRAAALEKKLTRMRIEVATPVDGLVIKRDDIEVTALAGRDVPVDPGRYTFIASAPGHADATVEADLSSPGQTIAVTIPPLVASTGDVVAPSGPASASATDPYADRLTLRPLALPRKMLQATAGLVWTTSPRYTGDGRTSPIETFVGARMGFGKIQARGGITVHTRYATEDYRPTVIQSVELGADYVLEPLLVTGLEYRRLHLFGGDIQQGFDFRAHIGTKKILSPSVAFVGFTGLAFQARKTRGQSGSPDAFQVLGDGAVQLAPIRRVTLEALARLRFNMSGDLYDDNTFLLDVGAGATGYLTRQLDAYISIVLVVLPQGIEDRIVTLGVNYRRP